METRKDPAKLWDEEQVIDCLGCTARFLQRLNEERRIQTIRISGESKIDRSDSSPSYVTHPM